MRAARSAQWVWIAAACLSTVGCAAARVQTDYDPEASFDGLTTYGWMPDRPPDDATNRAFLQRMITTAVDGELANKGYRLVDAGEADFWVNYQVAVGSELDVQTSYDLYGRGDRFYIDIFNDIDSRAFVAGTLVLDVLSPGERAILWRGVAEKAVEVGPENADRAIRESTRKMLARFPPEGGGR